MIDSELPYLDPIFAFVTGHQCFQIITANIRWRSFIYTLGNSLQHTHRNVPKEQKFSKHLWSWNSWILNDVIYEKNNTLDQGTAQTRRSCEKGMGERGRPQSWISEGVEGGSNQGVYFNSDWRLGDDGQKKCSKNWTATNGKNPEEGLKHVTWYRYAAGSNMTRISGVETELNGYNNNDGISPAQKW